MANASTMKTTAATSSARWRTRGWSTARRTAAARRRHVGTGSMSGVRPGSGGATRMPPVAWVADEGVVNADPENG